MISYEIINEVVKMMGLTAGEDPPLYRQPALKKIYDLASQIEQNMAELCLAATKLSTLIEMRGFLDSRLYNQIALLPTFSPVHPAKLEPQLPQDLVDRLARQIHANIDWFISSSFNRSQRDELRDYLQFAIENLEGRIEQGALPVKPRTFTKFKRLPPEIRDMIWKFAIPTAGQMVGIAVNHRFRHQRPKQRVWIEQPLQPIFHVNREVREISVKTYKLQLVNGDADGPDLFNTRIDPAKDSILLSYHSGTPIPPKTLKVIMQMASCPIFEIQHLFLHDSIWSDAGIFFQHLCFMNFKNLKRVTFIHTHEATNGMFKGLRKEGSLTLVPCPISRLTPCPMTCLRFRRHRFYMFLDTQLEKRGKRGFDDSGWEMPVVESMMLQATPSEVGKWKYGIDREV